MNDWYFSWTYHQIYDAYRTLFIVLSRLHGDDSQA